MKKQIFLFNIIVSLALLISADEAYSAVLEVGLNKQYATVESAWIDANPYDTILVYEGHYNPLLPIEDERTTKYGITIKAATDAFGRYHRVFFEGECLFVGKKDLTLQGFIYRGNNLEGPFLANGLMENLTIKDSIFYNNNDFGMGGFGLNISSIYGSTIGVTIQNCTFYDIRYGIGYPLPAIYASHSNTRDVQVKDSLFFFVYQTVANTTGYNINVSHSAYGQLYDSTHNGYVTFSNMITNYLSEDIFLSTNINDPYFLYLKPDAPEVFYNGSSTNSYIGARSIYIVPEPASSLAILSGVICILTYMRKK
ncbi:MAG: hypothetical protein SNJ70_07290 [Armatimonadota bacterium]